MLFKSLAWTGREFLSASMPTGQIHSAASYLYYSLSLAATDSLMGHAGEVGPVTCLRHPPASPLFTDSALLPVLLPAEIQPDHLLLPHLLRVHTA